MIKNSSIRWLSLLETRPFYYCKYLIPSLQNGIAYTTYKDICNNYKKYLYEISFFMSH